MVLFDDALAVLIRSGTGRPDWLPLGLFRVEEPRLPSSWLFEYYGDQSNDVPGHYGRQAIWGYAQIVRSYDHYVGIIERDPDALRIFYEQEGAEAEG